MDVQFKKVASIYTYKKPVIIHELRQFFMASWNDISVFSLQTGEILHSLKGHRAKVIGITINPYNKKSIISCDEDGNIISWAHDGNVNENKVFKLTERKCISFFDVLEDSSLLIGESMINGRYGSLSILSSLEDSGSVIMEKVKQGCNQVTKNRTIICGIQNNNILVTQYPKNGKYQKQRHAIKYNATCVALHAKEDILAVGGERGIISIYFNVVSSNPIIKNYHWHFLPVADLCFNRAGNELFSGGEEGVLMKWKLTSETKKPMPRLGMAIQYITVGEEETVITHVDNDVTIYRGESDTPAKGDSYIIRMEKSDNEIFLCHGPTNCIITHGSIGYLQFFSVESNRRKFQMDITFENYTASPLEHKNKSSHYSVKVAAVSEDGVWVVTYSFCNVAQSSENYDLKFWYYKEQSQKWIMNTFIQMPHNDKITSLTLSKEFFQDYFCISCSDDRTAKVWKTHQIGKRKYHVNWAVHIIKEFKKLIPRASAFHSDMSLMAISFDNYVTLYEPNNVSFICEFCNEEDKDDILDLQFTSEEYGPLILARTSNSLNVINLATYEKMCFKMDSFCMTINPVTGIVALFKKTDSIVYLLRITEGNEVRQGSITVDEEFVVPDGCEVRAAMWIPSSTKHILHFKTNLQEIFKLDDNSEEDNAANCIIASEIAIDTPFSRLLATTKTKLVENRKSNTDYVPSVKNWLDERIYEIDYKTDSFNELIVELNNKMLPDL